MDLGTITIEQLNRELFSSVVRYETEVDRAISKLGAHCQKLQDYGLGDEVALDIVLALSMTNLVREISEQIQTAIKSDSAAGSVRQSTLFQLMRVLAELEATDRLLIRFLNELKHRKIPSTDQISPAQSRTIFYAAQGVFTSCSSMLSELAGKEVAINVAGLGALERIAKALIVNHAVASDSRRDTKLPDPITESLGIT